MPLFYMKTFNNLSVLYNNESLIFFISSLCGLKNVIKTAQLSRLWLNDIEKKLTLRYIYIYIFYFLFYFCKIYILRYEKQTNTR